MLEFLPQKMQSALEYLNKNYLYELRIRADKPIFVNYKGEYVFLSSFGVTKNIKNAIYSTKEEIESIIYSASNFSVYSIEEQIKKGFITARGGVRIGLAGEYVFDKGNPLTIRNISSVCIRIPHEVIGASEEIFYRCMSDRIVNLLVASLPGCGKTTILRDLARIISEKHKKNILICDERGEISALHTGITCDTLLYADKSTAFEAGIRAMRPDIIITDELSSHDISSLDKLMSSGVCVIASIHAEKISKIPKDCCLGFDKIVFLKSGHVGKIACIYQKNGEEISLIWREEEENV